MAIKKSFKNDINPAMNFISQPDIIETVSEISPSLIVETKPPGGYKLDPRFIETKSRRLQLLVKPSLYDKLKKHADTSSISVNELVHGLLEKLL